MKTFKKSLSCVMPIEHSVRLGSHCISEGLSKMKTIPLTQGQFAMVDDADYEWLNQWKWYAQKDRKTFYAKRILCKRNGRQVIIKMCKLILGISETPNICDHIDHNGLNNQRSNLRFATKRENVINGTIENAHGYRGVSCQYGKGRIIRKTNPWKAQIINHGKFIHLGVFGTKEEAALAYNEAAKELFGEFAHLNIIEEEAIPEPQSPYKLF